jgi:Domain of unknown function (DUF4410)
MRAAPTADVGPPLPLTGYRISQEKLAMKNPSRLCCSLYLFGIFLFVGAGAHGQQSAVPPAQQPFVFTPGTMIYVSDFELDAENFQADQGRTKIVQRPRLLKKDPATEAKKLINDMANDIVNDLKKAGYKAERWSASDPKPDTGVWVHGVFTELDEGNRIRRAVIGFGAGESKMDLYVAMNDLAHPEQPLYNVSESGDSGKKVGAAITINPYVAAAKFVMEKNAPEKTVKKTAGEISQDLLAHLKKHQPTAAAANN